MKIIRVLLLASFFTFLAFSSKATIANELVHTENSGIEFDEVAIQKRLQGLDISVDTRYNSIVRGYINGYLVRNRDKSRRILGRSSMYFSMIERYLHEYNLPDDLKYLPIVESALVPTAVSRSGAVGLWQFMKPTGKEYNLSANRYMDERRDPEKSTEAAIQYLSDLYDRFGDWNLVLAAYNAGPGTVSRAMKKHKKNDYWSLRKYLPKETQNYVPAFIAASYLMNYYFYHDLEPTYPSREYLHTAERTIYNSTSFEEVSILSGVDVEIIKNLNPVYLRNLIPENELGSRLVLPHEGMALYTISLNIPDHLRSPMVLAASFDMDMPENFSFFETVAEKEYVVRSGDNLYNLAKQFDCVVKDLTEWNKLSTSKLKIGQKLRVMQTEKLFIQRSLIPQFEVLNPGGISVKSEINTTLEDQKKIKAQTIASCSKYNGEIYEYYQVRRQESLLDISRQMDGVELKELLELNHFSITSTPRPGQKIKIRTLY